MDVQYWVKGFVLGLSIAAPVGQIGVLCVRRTVAEGRVYGLASGLGAATAETVYGAVAAFGITFVTSLLMSQQFWLKLGGGLLLLFLGVRTFMSHPAQSSAAIGSKSLLAAYGSTLLLTLANPLTILSFSAIFAGLGAVGSDQDSSSSALVVAGVFSGSALWWFILSWVVGALRGRFNQRSLALVNRLSGIIIVGFGAASIFGLFAH